MTRSPPSCSRRLGTKAAHPPRRACLRSVLQNSTTLSTWLAQTTSFPTNKAIDDSAAHVPIIKARNAAKASKSLRGILFRFSRQSLTTTTTETPTLDSRKYSSASDSPTLTTFTTTTTYCASSTSSSPTLHLPTPNQQSLSIWDAEEFIREFITDHWSNHAAYIKVDCALTLDELHALGRLPQAAGSLACQRLIRVPAIHEQVAASLWENLVEAAPALALAPMTATTTRGDGARKKSVVDMTMLRDAKRSVKKLLGRQQHHRRHEDGRHAASVRCCPFCSGRCAEYRAPPPPAAAVPAGLDKKRQPSWQMGEDDFWQREDPCRRASRRLSGMTETAAGFSGSCGAEEAMGCGWGKWLGRVGRNWWCERVGGKGGV